MYLFPRNIESTFLRLIGKPLLKPVLQSLMQLKFSCNYLTKPQEIEGVKIKKWFPHGT